MICTSRARRPLARLAPALTASLVCFAAACSTSAEGLPDLGLPVALPEDGGGDATPVDASDGPVGDGAVGDRAAPDAPDARDLFTGPVGETVATAEGTVRGQPADDLVIFRGIPFAEPPVGDLRFRAPVPHAPWDGELDATAFGPPCIPASAAEGDEDCLTLNVWAHVAPGGDRRPVMVFVPGGGFIEGAGSLPGYEGSLLARETGQVVVTLNYRLGVLGFLATDALRAESGDGSVGNYGLRDQIEALRWVQRNIDRFGGDPTRVLLFGESAGGISVCALLASPSTAGLYSAAVMESGPCQAVSLADQPSMLGRPGLETGSLLLAATPCAGSADPLACLRQQPAADLVRAQATVAPGPLLGLNFSPTVDGVTLPRLPLAALADPADATPRVPVIVGANHDEMTLFLQALVLADEATYRTTVTQAYGTQLGGELLELYPAASFATPKQALEQLLGDQLFNCPAEAAALASATGGAPTFLYAFDRPWGAAFAPYGAFHGIELYSLFGSYAALSYAPTSEDEAVGARLRAAWAKLAEGAGAPDDTPAWPAYTSEGPAFLQLGTTESRETLWREGRCPALRKLGVTP